MQSASYDAIVVGSGIAGGWAAKELTERGLRVLLLERGRNVEHIKDYVNATKAPWEYLHRGGRTIAMEETYQVLKRDLLNEKNLAFWVNEQESPYTEVKRFDWYRGYQVGGRSLTWGRQSYRWSDFDFEANVREGVAVDWPIRYEELAPWYDHVEKHAGISGSRDGLAQLLGKLAETEDLLWVRFLYAYPNRVTQKLLDTIAEHPRLAKYMDMPLQHASRNVLARMKRGSNGEAFLKLLERIRTTIPGVSLRTSFIVGFPGETEADFEELCGFVKAAKLDWMGVFEYSDVDNAGSYALDGKVDPETISERRNQLMAIQKKISRENLRTKFVGAKTRAGKKSAFTALIEGPSRDNPLVWEARLEGMAPEIDGKLYLTDIELPGGEVAEAGDVARVEITKADAYDLVGRVVEILPRPAARVGIGAASIPPVAASEKLHRIATGAPLRVLA